MNKYKTVNDTQQFTLMSRFKSIGYATQGILFMLKTQHNAWLHAVSTIVVIGLGGYWQIKIEDWRWLVVAIALVWMAETFNTAVEYVCDVVSPEYSELVEHAKDIAAGAVLLSAVGAAVIGILTLKPYISA